MSVTFPKKPASPTNAVVAAHPEQTVYLQSYLPEVFKGLAVSMKHFFDNTKEMVLGKRPDPVLERYDEGIDNGVIHEIRPHASGITQEVDLYWGGSMAQDSWAGLSGMAVQVDGNINFGVSDQLCGFVVG